MTVRSLVMGFIFSAGFLFVLGPAAIAHADGRGEKDVIFQGEVTRNSVNELVEKVRQAREDGWDPIVVILSSEGGDLQAALDAAETLRSLGIDTRVENGDDCDSSCTVLFAAGRRRAAGDNSHFVFHPVGADGYHLDADGRRTTRFTREERDQTRDRYADDWDNSVRKVDPRLADDLDRERTMKDGRGTYYDDQTGGREQGRRYSGRDLRQTGYVNDDPRNQDERRREDRRHQDNDWRDSGRHDDRRDDSRSDRDRRDDDGR